MKSDVDILKIQIDALFKEVTELKQQAEEETWYDAADVKRLYNFSDSTLKRYRKDGKIPFVKLGCRYLYPKSFFTKSLKKKMQHKHLL